MQRDLHGRTIVITGVCRGIGTGIVKHLARNGANLVTVFNAECVHETAE